MSSSQNTLQQILNEITVLKNDHTVKLDRIEDQIRALTGDSNRPSPADNVSATAHLSAVNVSGLDDIFLTNSNPPSSDGWDYNPLYRASPSSTGVALLREDDNNMVAIEMEEPINRQTTSSSNTKKRKATSTTEETDNSKKELNNAKVFKALSRKASTLRTLSSKHGALESETLQKGVMYRIYRLLIKSTIRPENKYIWDVFLSWTMLWVCFVSPFVICFGMSDDLPTFFHLFELIVDGCFTLDILLTMLTRYVNEDGVLVTNRWQIFKQYAKGWLVIDVVSVLPMHLILLSSSGFTLLRMTKLLKMLRLLKATRVARLLRQRLAGRAIEGIFTSPYWKVFRFMVIVALLSHWCACLFHIVALFEDGDNKPNWVEAENLQDSTSQTRYLNSLYWSLATMTSVGYGDVVPVTSLEKIISVICMLVGVTIFAYIMGAVTSLIGALNSTSSKIAAKRQRVDEFLKARMIPSFLGNKVREFYSYIVMKEVANDDGEIIGGLPSKLRTQLILFLFRDTLAKVLYFEDKPPQFIAELVMMMKMEFYSPGDFVVVQAEASTEMYVVVEGRLSIRAYTDIQSLHEQLYCGDPVVVPFKTLGHIEAGSQFGEYACLTNELRTATVVAETFCELYSLSRDGLLSVMDRWPEYRNEISQSIMKQSKATKNPPKSESLETAEEQATTKLGRDQGPSRSQSLQEQTFLDGSIRPRSTSSAVAYPLVSVRRNSSSLSPHQRLENYSRSPFSSLDQEL